MRARGSIGTVRPLVAAAVAGALAAFLLTLVPRAESRAAFTHCTRYAPVYNQDYNCYVMQGFPNGTPSWRTPSVAQRDGNHIYMSRSNHFDLCYVDSSGVCPTYWWLDETASSGDVGGSGTAYVYATCSVYITAYTTGYCATEWH